MQLLNPTNVLLALALPFAATQTSTTTIPTSGLPAALPSCAEPALLASIAASGCQVTDAPCICSRPGLLPNLITAINEACDPADKAAVVAFAQTYCGTSAILSGEASLTGTTKVAVAASTNSGSVTAELTAVSFPSSISAPASASTPSGALVIDTTALSTSVSATSAATTHNYTGTMTYSTTATAKPTNGAHVGGAPQNHGYSFAAFAVAVGAMAFLFAEL